MGPVLFLDDFIVKAIDGNDSGFHFTGIEHLLSCIGHKGTEDVAGAEVDPHRMVVGRLNHRLNGKLWENITLIFPFFCVVDTFACQFHFRYLFLLLLRSLPTVR